MIVLIRGGVLQHMVYATSVLPQCYLVRSIHALAVPAQCAAPPGGCFSPSRMGGPMAMVGARPLLLLFSPSLLLHCCYLCIYYYYCYIIIIIIIIGVIIICYCYCYIIIVIAIDILLLLLLIHYYIVIAIIVILLLLYIYILSSSASPSLLLLLYCYYYFLIN